MSLFNTQFCQSAQYFPCLLPAPPSTPSTTMPALDFSLRALQQPLRGGVATSLTGGVRSFDPAELRPVRPELCGVGRRLCSWHAGVATVAFAAFLQPARLGQRLDTTVLTLRYIRQRYTRANALARLAPAQRAPPSRPDVACSQGLASVNALETTASTSGNHCPKSPRHPLRSAALAKLVAG